MGDTGEAQLSGRFWPTEIVAAPYGLTPARAWRLWLASPPSDTAHARATFDAVLAAWERP